MPKVEIENPKSRIQNRTVLGVLLIAGFALRLYKLDQGIWYDEILTYAQFARLPFGEIITTYTDQNQHFLYSLAAHLSFLVFGESTWALRFPAVLFGIGSIWALFLLGCQITNCREALLSAALLTVSYHHIWFSQSARGYIGLLFWTLLSSWLLLRELSEGKARLWVVYAIAVALGVYTHVTMLFVAAGQFIYYLLTVWLRRKESWPHKWSGLFLGFGVAGVLSIMLYAPVFPQMFGGLIEQGADKSAAVKAWKNPLWTIYELAKNLKIGFTTEIAGIAAVTLFGAGIWSFKRDNPTVIYLLVIPVLITAVAMKAIGHPIWPRLFFFSAGFGAVILVRGAMFWGDRIAKSSFLGTAMAIGLIAVSAMSVPSVYVPKQDYVGALMYVKENFEPGDIIVTVGPVASYPYSHFYKTDWQAVETLQDLKSLRARGKRTWLLYSMPLYVDATHPEIMNLVRRDFKIVKEFHGSLGDGTIFVSRTDADSS